MRRPFFVLFASLLLLAPLAAGPAATAPQSGHAHPDAPIDALRRLRGAAFERGYLSMMIPHHEAAITMAKDLLAKAYDLRVRAWADHTILTQSREIQQMRALAGTRPDESSARRMREAMTPMIAAVRRAEDAERAFVDSMIPHHAMAVEAAMLALERADRPEVLALSRNIVIAQAQEIFEFRTWPARR